jgi:hypothetical protein
MEAAAILFSMRHPGAVPPGEVPARPDIDLNRAASDDEGGGGAADHSTTDGGATAADGSAPAVHGHSATKALPEMVRPPFFSVLTLSPQASLVDHNPVV